MQTQITGLNDEGVTVGFWSTMNNASMVNDNFGFFSVGGRSYSVNFPTGNNASPPVDQLLGVSNHDVAVGFYTNAQGNNRGYEYNIPQPQLHPRPAARRPGRDRGPEPDRRGHQQRRRRGLLLRQDLLADRSLPPAARWPVHHASGHRSIDDPGLRRQRPR